MAREMHFSDQAIGSIMMALQKGLVEQTDITDILKSLKLRDSEVGVMVMNPSLVKFDTDDEYPVATE